MGPINSKITLTRKRKKEKETERRKKGGVEKKAMDALLVFMMASLEITFGRKKNCWTQKIYLTVTFSKIRLDIQGENKVIT